MIGLTTSESLHSYRRCCASVPRKAARRRYIVREWSAEQSDLPVYDWRGNTRVRVEPKECVTIVNRAGDCFYPARGYFATAPVDSDMWASAAWKLLNKRTTSVGGAMTANPDVALSLAQAGAFVFPCDPASKMPRLKEWKTRATNSPEGIRYFGNGMVAVLCPALHWGCVVWSLSTLMSKAGSTATQQWTRCLTNTENWRLVLPYGHRAAAPI
jgi:hypothetical protein